MKGSWPVLDLSTKVVCLALTVQDNWTFRHILTEEMEEFIAKIAMAGNLDIKEGQRK